MTKFKSVPFRYLPNSVHWDYCMTVSKALADAPPALLAALGTLPAEFDRWLEVETALMNWVAKSYLTEEIATAARRMNRALVALKAQVRSRRFSLAPDIAEAAYRVYIMLKNYGWVYLKSYGERLGATLAILQQLNGAFAADAATLGLAAHTRELQEAREEFKRLLALRDNGSLDKPEENFKTVMRSIEKVYHRITVMVDAGAAINVSPAFEAFINRLNPRIESLHDRFHRVRRNMRLAQPEGIPPQVFTGQPLTPTPAVFYTAPHGEILRLQLGRDYDVSYRNNTKPGTAQCTFRGKGLYAGNRTVTFVILRVED